MFTALDRANRELGYVHRSALNLFIVIVDSPLLHTYMVKCQIELRERECAPLRDMRVSNIMEHRSDANLLLPKGFDKKRPMQIKLPGMELRKHHELFGTDL